MRRILLAHTYFPKIATHCRSVNLRKEQSLTTAHACILKEGLSSCSVLNCYEGIIPVLMSWKQSCTLKEKLPYEVHCCVLNGY